MNDYRTLLRDFRNKATEYVDTIEAEVNGVLEFARSIDKSNVTDMRDGLDKIIADLSVLSEKLY
jgi:hypothetical protein